MYDIYVIGSSSSGNCIYVDTGDCKILLDVGLTIKAIKDGLRDIGVRLADIDYILVTHEHIDHNKALKSIDSLYNLKVVASNGTLMASEVGGYGSIVIEDGATISLNNISITAHSVEHDALEPLCFTITNSLGEKLLYMTDYGSPMYESFDNYEVYIVEANYALSILDKNYESGVLPQIRYARAISGKGHASLEQTLDFLGRNVGDKTQEIILSHLSSQNANSDMFKSIAMNEFPLNNINIANHGLHIKCGQNPQPF